MAWSLSVAAVARRPQTSRGRLCACRPPFLVAGDVGGNTPHARPKKLYGSYWTLGLSLEILDFQGLF